MDSVALVNRITTRLDWFSVSGQSDISSCSLSILVPAELQQPPVPPEILRTCAQQLYSPLAIQRAVQPAPFLSSLDTCPWIMFFPCHSFILCFLFFFVSHLSSHFTPLHFLPLCFPPCVNVYPTVIVFTCLSLSAPHWCILLCPFPSLLAGSSLSTILVFQPFPSVLSDVVPVLCLDLFFVAFRPCMDFAFLPVSFLNCWPVLDCLPGYDTCLSWTSYLVVTLAPCFTFQKSPYFSI